MGKVSGLSTTEVGSKRGSVYRDFYVIIKANDSPPKDVGLAHITDRPLEPASVIEPGEAQKAPDKEPGEARLRLNVYCHVKDHQHVHREAFGKIQFPP